MTEAANNVVSDVEVIATPESEAAQAETDLSAGFNKVHGVQAASSPEEKTDKVPEEKPQPAVEAKPAATPAADDKPRVFGMTEDEFKAALAKSGQAREHVDAEVRKVFSKIGEINRSVQDLSKNLSAGKSGRKITADLLKRVNEELPGLGEALAQDLSEILGGADTAQAAAEQKGQPFDPEKYHAEKLAPALNALEARITKASEEAQLELVTYIHSDFEQIVQSEDFKKWLGTLTKERHDQVVGSPRAIVAAQAVTEFKGWKETAAKEAKKKTSRLESAITPKGGGTPPSPQQPDDEAEFSAGYKKAAKK